MFGERLRYDLSERFPLVTTKQVHFRSIAVELLWFLRGDSNVGWLRDNGVTIWDEWADADGELARSTASSGGRGRRPTAGRSTRSRTCSATLRTDPDSRRMIVSAWNVADLPDMALAPCHAFFQFYVADGRLSCQLYQRSADMFLGVPFNIASYALLTRMVAEQVGLSPATSSGSAATATSTATTSSRCASSSPARCCRSRSWRSRPAPSLFDYTYEHFTVRDYRHHPAIRAAVAV